MSLQRNSPRNELFRLITTIAFWMTIAIAGRILPHPANVSPLTSLSLLAGALLAPRTALIVTFITLIISDFFLSIINHYPLFGSWTIFTYSGFAAIIYLGSRFSVHASLLKYLGFVSIASLGFWVWTNFGVWLTSGMYPSTFEGLVNCYTLALPFLRNALYGDWSWMIVLWSLLRLTLKSTVLRTLWAV